MTLSLPIVVGKKYVRRDGKVVEVKSNEGDGWLKADYRTVKARDGGWSPAGNPCEYDLVADYIETAKGHPHADKMMEFAKDATESETPWDGWQWKRVEESGWRDCEDMMPTWSSWLDYRRKPTVTPDPHAESAAEYAKDMAVSDKAWERWEGKGAAWKVWQTLEAHPSWYSDFQYRRKEQP